jgi:NAD(P)-dependent dehydrogenase (short-subunit alcohol dehydrogenase family)
MKDHKVSFSRDKVAVVTGASSGVGKALALGFAAQGATVCLVARNIPKLSAVIANASGERERLRAYPADITKDEEIKQLKTRLEDDFGHVDILVHCAGVISLGPLKSVPIEDLDSQYRCNVRGPYLLTQALLPALRLRQGQIVFINSSAGITARANVGQYAASKHALKALADSLREEVNADGVRVLSVYLGRTATPMQQEIHRAEGRTYRSECLIQPEEVATLLVSLLAVQRSAEITDFTLRPLLKPVQG